MALRMGLGGRPAANSQRERPHMYFGIGTIILIIILVIIFT